MSRSLALVMAALLAGGCRTAPPEPGPTLPPPVAGVAVEREPKLPPIPPARERLDIELMYPAEGATITARDSTFIFGNVGTGGATLTINGAPVEVQPNGAFLAFLPVPADGVYRLNARGPGGAVAELTRNVKVPAVARAAPELGGLHIVAGSVGPSGSFVGVADEPFTVRFRGTPGATARLVLPDGSTVPLTEQRVTEIGGGFMQDRPPQPREFIEYAATFPLGLSLAAERAETAQPTLASAAGAGTAYVELIRGGDTLRTPVDLNLGVMPAGTTRIGVAATEDADQTIIGTAVPPPGTPYHWFFQNGTRLEITGERNGQYRVRLSRDLSVWVNADEVRLLPEGAPPPSASVGSIRAKAEPGWADVVLALSERVPTHVHTDGSEITLYVYGARSRTNWIYYGPEDPLVRDISWSQPETDLYRLTVELSQPVWGYRTFYDEGGNLVLRVRRPPRIDASNPLAGRVVAVDAGHPPGGAIGPTGLTEAEANLMISRRLIRMLRERGARVVEPRPDTAAVSLGDRIRIAEEGGAELLVSVHHNAFGDGVNPWERNGTSVLVNRSHSLELARAFQRELVAEFHLRDLGVIWADRALVRPTWMPSALTETMFMMIPRQEAALRDPEVQERSARAHLRALEAFLRDRSRHQP